MAVVKLPKNSNHVLLMLTESEEIPDDQLLNAYVQSQSHEAFAALVRRYGPMVLGVCRRIAGHTQDAEDAFQATFAVLVRKARSIRRKQAIGAWLHQVARRTAKRARATSTRQEKPIASVAADVEARPENGGAAQEHFEILDEEIGRLPESLRMPIILCYLQGLTNREAAERLDCPEGTIVSRLARAREKLRHRLVRRGLVLSGAAAVAALLTQAAAAALISPSVFDAVLNSSIGLATSGAILSAGAARLADETIKSLIRQKLLSCLGVALGVASAIGLFVGITYLTGNSVRSYETKLQGRWELKRMEIAGRDWPFDVQQRHEITFANGEFVLHHVEGGNIMEFRGKFTLDPNQPAQFIDMKIGDGGIALCRYEIEGNRLNLCMTDPGAERPKSLKPDPNLPVMLFEFQR